eukprot:CAMPEP_0197251104 /NCGR_PEP_ID=MMETSP1429-20130617/55751_1 /TAXON_ID=49237 /ORGANISM="Chaetoceros  sp., Strain UNC1202" /LENGTH=89 /DNA_ID=CAMNT_0042713097 /DNA_START=106 /DNA_END=375 /DNA_ORIENTATION=+
MAYKWLCRLQETHPHLAKRARELNDRDGFVMKYDPEEVELREKREREKKRAKKETHYTDHSNSRFATTGLGRHDAKRSRIERDGRIVSP